jgi:hypothetical protein
MWEPRRLTTLWASTACYRIALPLLVFPIYFSYWIDPNSPAFQLIQWAYRHLGDFCHIFALQHIVYNANCNFIFYISIACAKYFILVLVSEPQAIDVNSIQPQIAIET